ncbi:MAG: hypothetical protein ABII79_03685 [bacterium]
MRIVGITLLVMALMMILGGGGIGVIIGLVGALFGVVAGVIGAVVGVAAGLVGAVAGVFGGLAVVFIPILIIGLIIGGIVHLLTAL